MTTLPEQMISCIRCAVQHEHDKPTRLAYLVANPEGGPALLHAATVVTVRTAGITPRLSWHSAHWAPEPLSTRAKDPVMLWCPRCRTRVGPVSAKRIATLFAQGRGRGGTLLFPIPAPGVPSPAFVKWSERQGS